MNEMTQFKVASRRYLKIRSFLCLWICDV